MRIIELRSENFKRLKAVAIRPDGSLIKISGKNGAGKSSLLDSIHVALAGKAVAPPKPIRKGQSKSTIRLSLGEKDVELIVTRTFTKKKDGDEYTTSLTVESPAGATFRSPQATLDKLVEGLSFDPLAFARALAKDQVNMLKRLVPAVNFDAIERANQADYDKRRDINRHAKELRAQAEGIAVPADAALEPIDESALVDELEKAHEHNSGIERRKENRQRMASEIDVNRRAVAADKARCDELLAEIQKIRDRALRLEAQTDEMQAKLDGAPELPAPIETADVRARIEQAKAHNTRVDQAQQRTNLETKAKVLEEEAEALTRAMEDRNESKAKAIAAAKLPVPGLTFGAGEVELNGVPFEQASDAEQLRASVAIAAALSPQLKVIRIRDGSLLDSDGLALLAEFAEEHGTQIWLEKVADDDRCGIVIEDGMVKQHEEPAKAATG